MKKLLLALTALSIATSANAMTNTYACHLVGDQKNYTVTVDFTKKTMKMGYVTVKQFQPVFGDCLAKACYEGSYLSDKSRMDFATKGAATLTVMHGTPDNKDEYECDQVKNQR
jgi:hypothetical protein